MLGFDAILAHFLKRKKANIMVNSPFIFTPTLNVGSGYYKQQIKASPKSNVRLLNDGQLPLGGKKYSKEVSPPPVYPQAPQCPTEPLLVNPDKHFPVESAAPEGGAKDV
jgi:hypothetical protein